jgi:predicted Zn-dependent protease
VRLAAHAPATSFEAYERYVTGLHHWNRRTPQDLEVALEELGRATVIDPAFAPAWGATALVHVTRLLYGVCAPVDAAALAVTAVDRALALDRGQTSALTARACLRAVHDWDAGAAERDFLEVIARAPSDATARQWFAINLLAPLGRLDEAREQLARAHELDPLSPSILVSSGVVAHVAGDVPGALALFGRALSIDPAFGAARYFLGQALLSAGKPEEAVTALDASGAAMGHSPEVRAALATACAAAGVRDRAAALLAGLTEARDGRWVSPALTAMVLAALGDLDGAVADVERAIEARAVEVIWLETRPAWASLRADARYPALITRRDAAARTAARTRVPS